MNTTPIDHKIEFMAWDKKNNRMSNPKSLEDFHEFTTIKRSPYRFEDIEFMQLTALRSINDEPIYNHMIVRDAFNDLYVVDMFDYELMSYLDMNPLEIVGNRFQSPELLELCK